MGFEHLKRMGAVERLERAAASIASSGLSHNIYFHPYQGSMSMSGALLKSFDVSNEIIAQWDGDILSLHIPDLHIALLQELINSIEAIVDEDIETWSDSATTDEVIRAFRKLARLIEFSPSTLPNA